MIRNLYNQGLKIIEIARIVGMTRKTVSKHLKNKTTPAYIRKSLPTKLDEYKRYIQERLEKYNISSYKIYEEILNQGYTGKYGIVNLFVQSIKKN